MYFPRSSGILLHPTSLPGKYGIGDFGPAAFEFVDFLADSGQSYWQMLPLGPTGFGDSPYQCFSAFAGNTNLISPELLCSEGFLNRKDIDTVPRFPKRKVDYAAVGRWKGKLLQRAFEKFRSGADAVFAAEFDRFRGNSKGWLSDYALFRSIKDDNELSSWLEWDDGLKFRDPEKIDRAKIRLKNQIQAQKFFQYLFYRQWDRLKRYANRKGVRIIGDVPIFVAMDSTDVWCNPDLFKLNKDLSPEVVSGVPPDYFSETGQLWGNPIYDWRRMRSNGFRWWVDRFRTTLEMFDVVRIDHFRGFSAAWEVPGADETAVDGRWVDVPGHDLFATLQGNFGELPIIAEDLGVMTEDVEHLRDSFGFPGMRILQFGFGGDANSRDLPHNYIEHCIAYTGTHDNDTSVGWIESAGLGGDTRSADQIEREIEYCRSYLGAESDEIHWQFIRAVWGSVAKISIAPLQDVLGLGSESRMNLPATIGGNWVWRFRETELSDKHARKLKEITEVFGR